MTSAAPTSTDNPSAPVWVVLAALTVLLGMRLADASAPVSGQGAGPASTILAPQENAGPVRPVHPVAIRIADMEIQSPVIELGLQADRTLEVPHDALVTGWWSGGSRPGDNGPAVIVGHVDSRTGPGVFYRLRDLEPGDLVEVAGSDGDIVRFTVQRSEWHHKDAFPTTAVYGPTSAPELRLVTCGGRFDPAARSYEENLIVFATLAR